MKRYSVDRIEGNYIVCVDDNRECVNIHKKLLPPDVREGHVVIDSGNGKFYIDYTETAERRFRMAELQTKLFKKSE